METSVPCPAAGWSPATTRAMLDGDVRGTGVAILEDPNMTGVRLLPVGHNKHPLVDRWSHDATDDPGEWLHMMDIHPDAGVAMVCGSGLIVIDDDSGGTCDLASLGVPGDTWAERTAKGVHSVCRVPEACYVRRCAKLPGGGGDVLGATCGYVVIAPTPPRFLLHPYAPILPLPATSPIRGLMAGDEVAPTVSIRIRDATERDVRAAQRVLEDLCGGTYGWKVRLLVAGRWREVVRDCGEQRYPSQSEADLGLMAVAVYGARADPTVMDQVMRQTGLMRAKWDQRHYSDGSTYGKHTIAVAIATNRWARALAHLAALCDIRVPLPTVGGVHTTCANLWSPMTTLGHAGHDGPGSPAGAGVRSPMTTPSQAGHDGHGFPAGMEVADDRETPMPVIGGEAEEGDGSTQAPGNTVFSGTWSGFPVFQQLEKPERHRAIETFARRMGGEGGAIRVPVYDLSVVLGVDRRTITRDLKELEARKIIETDRDWSNPREHRVRLVVGLAATTPPVRAGPANASIEVDGSRPRVRSSHAA